jgi:hypothetical protein
VPGSVRPNLTLGFSKASGPGSPPRSASSKLRNKREPTSSRPILSSSTESTNYADPSKPNTQAHIVLAPLPRTLQPHHRSCMGGAWGLPTSGRPRPQFPWVPSSEPDPTLDGTGPHERAGNIAVFGQLASAPCRLCVPLTAGVAPDGRRSVRPSPGSEKGRISARRRSNQACDNAREQPKEGAWSGGTFTNEGPGRRPGLLSLSWWRGPIGPLTTTLELPKQRPHAEDVPDGLSVAVIRRRCRVRVRGSKIV